MPGAGHYLWQGSPGCNSDGVTKLVHNVVDVLEAQAQPFSAVRRTYNTVALQLHHRQPQPEAGPPAHSPGKTWLIVTLA